MKFKICNILIVLLLTATTFAQAPDKLSYQAVVRDAGNTAVNNQQVGMQISILQTTATGMAVYVETQTPTTNTNGLVSIEIGMGSVVTGDFSGIDWSAGPYFIKTETDLTGGTNYTITGTSQMLSVPYALYSNVAESLDGVNIDTKPDTEEGLKIIRGSIDKNGNILAGTGFSISNLTGGPPGKRRITFDVPFSGLPSVVVTTGDISSENEDNVANANVISVSSFVVVTYDSTNGDGQPEPSEFQFIAIGPK